MRGRAAPGRRRPERKRRKLRKYCPKGHEYSRKNTGYKTNKGKRHRFCKTCAARSERRRHRTHPDAERLWQATLALPEHHPYRLQMLAAKAEYDHWLATEASIRQGRGRRVVVVSPNAPNFLKVTRAPTPRHPRARQPRNTRGKFEPAPPL